MPDPEETNPPAPKGDEGKTFTQADVDRIVADRLSREKAKYADYDELKAKADKFDEQEAANQSEADRLRDQLAQLTTERDELNMQALRHKVAADKGLTPAQAKRLVGTNEDELAADADEILEAFPAQGATPPPDRQPTSDLRGGNDPTEGDPVDVRDVVDSIPRGI